MDVALGVAVTDRVARLALVDSAAPGTVIDQFVLDVAEHPVEVLTETVVGTDRSLAGENHRLVATRLCWPDQAKADELQHALQDSGVHDVAVISEAQAATALVGAAHAGSAVLLVGDETATLSVVGDPDAPPTMVAVAPVAGADATSTVDTLMARLGDQALAPGDVFLVGRSAEHTTVLADQLRAASTMRVGSRARQRRAPFFAAVGAPVWSRCSQQGLRDLDVAAAQPLTQSLGLRVEAGLVGDALAEDCLDDEVQCPQIRQHVTGDDQACRFWQQLLE